VTQRSRGIGSGPRFGSSARGIARLMLRLLDLLSAANPVDNLAEIMSAKGGRGLQGRCLPIRFGDANEPDDSQSGTRSDQSDVYAACKSVRAS